MGLYKLPKIIGKDNKPPFGARINWHHPLSQGLVGAWLLNEGGGNKVFSERNITGQLTGTWGYDGVTLGTTANTIATPIPLTNTNFPYGTIEIRVKLNWSSPDVNTHYLIDTDGDRFLVYFGGGTTAIYLWFGGVYKGAVTSSVSAGIHQFVVTWPNLLLYQDAVLLNDFSDGTLAENSTILYTGSRVSITESLDGNIIYFRIWNRVLSPAEISQLYANPYQMFLPSVWDAYFVPAAAPPPTGGKSIFGYDSIFHAGGIIQT